MPVQPTSSKIRKIRAGETHKIGDEKSPFFKQIETKDVDPTISLNKEGATEKLSEKLQITMCTIQSLPISKK